MLYTYEQAQLFNAAKAIRFHKFPCSPSSREYSIRFEPIIEELHYDQRYNFSLHSRVIEYMLHFMDAAGNINPAFDFNFKQVFSVNTHGWHQNDEWDLNPNNNPANGGLYITNMSELKAELKSAYTYYLKQHNAPQQFVDYFEKFWQNAEKTNDTRKMSLLDISKDGTMVKTSIPGYVLFLDGFVLKNRNGAVVDGRKIPYITNLSTIQDCITKNYTKRKNGVMQTKDVATLSNEQKYDLFMHVLQAMAKKKFGNYLDKYFTMYGFQKAGIYSHESDIAGGSEDRFSGSETSRYKTVTYAPDHIHVQVHETTHSMNGSYDSEEYSENNYDKQYPFSKLTDKMSFVKLAGLIL